MDRKKERNFVSHFNYNDKEIYDKQGISSGFNVFWLILAHSWQIILSFQKNNLNIIYFITYKAHV